MCVWVSVCSVTSILSNSLQPYGLQPSRLLCPQDFTGKNIGVGCDALLQGILPTQGLKPHLLHCQWVLYRLATEGTNLCIKFFF